MISTFTFSIQTTVLDRLVELLSIRRKSQIEFVSCSLDYIIVVYNDNRGIKHTAHIKYEELKRYEYENSIRAKIIIEL